MLNVELTSLLEIDQRWNRWERGRARDTQPASLIQHSTFNIQHSPKSTTPTLTFFPQ